MRPACRIVLLLLSTSEASWVCPVAVGRESDPGNPAAFWPGWRMESLEVLITPVPVTGEENGIPTPWNYRIRETFRVEPTTDPGSLRFCLDLGVVPEGVRELVSITLDGEAVEPCSVLVRRLYPGDSESDTALIILREDPGSPEVVSCVLEELAAYRAGFDSEDDFRSAVPETARTHAVLVETPPTGAPVTVEVQYVVMGWTFLAGGEPLRYSLFQGSLWAGVSPEASILVDLSGIPDRGDWRIDLANEAWDGDEVPSLRIPAGGLLRGDGSRVITVFPPDLTDPL